MRLSEIQVGEVVHIVKTGGERSFRRRLMELGLVPGTRIELLRVAPLGDPVELLVRGASLSIRKTEASAIQVQAATSSAAHSVLKSVGLAPDTVSELRA